MKAAFILTPTPMASDVVLPGTTDTSEGGRGPRGGSRLTCGVCPRPPAPARPPAWPRGSAASPLFLHQHKRPVRFPPAFPTFPAVLTELHEGVAGPGVAGERQLPAGRVREAAGEGVPAVVHQTRLELKQKRG